jgi:monovalent cation:proton antiporter-2 (CPA2) family protein
MQSHAFLYYLLAFLGTAVIAVPLFSRLGLGSVLGYLVAGSLLGPWGVGLINDAHQIMGIAEFGVMLLLFVIGLELKPSRLWVMRKAVFGMGGAQVALSTILFGVIISRFGHSGAASLVAGLGLSLSSTAFALQILAEKGQINTSFGRASFAILLFQDLAVIPLLGLVPLLGSVTHETSAFSILPAFRIIGIIAAYLIVARFLLRPLFRMVADTKNREVFTGAALLVVIGSGALMEAVGLSMALGTFLSGVLLADSEYRHQLETDLEPFKGLLLGLFFMSVGMSVDYGLILKRPIAILGIVLGFMCLKSLVVYGVGRAARFSDDAAKNMAAILPQGGEFAFVLYGVAVQSGVMESSLADLLIVSVTFSMVLTPLFGIINEKLLCRRPTPVNEPFDNFPLQKNPVIIAGFGRVGQIVGRVLRVQNIPFTALEHDPEQVEQIRRFGNEIYYGDASRLDLLEVAGAKEAKVFVLAIDDVESSLRTARMVKEHFPHLKIFARARNRDHVYELMTLGAHVINRETFASSLELSEQLLVELGMTSDVARLTVLKFRGHDERVLIEQQKLYGDETKLVNYSKQAAQQLAGLFKSDDKS